MKKIVLGMLFLTFLIVTRSAHAQSNQSCICHNVQNNPVTVCSDDNSHIIGHGQHLISGMDTLGACQQASPTPTNSPSATPTPTSTPNQPTNTPTPTPTNSPSATPTPTPTNAPTPTNGPNVPTPTSTPNQPPILGCIAQLPSYASYMSGGTTIINTNLMCASQVANSVNVTGGNLSSGNIGPHDMQTGGAVSNFNMSISGNENHTIVDLPGTFLQNLVSLVNSGANLLLNAAAISNN